uniref:Desmoglein 2 n=1 Tax=Bos indicus x Bos taurus TaxID=30522 RepID=A0A4W2BT94_BOBOX
MAWLPFRTTGALAILMVVLLVHGELRIQTKGQYEEYETAIQGKRRYKREWVKFARPCREGEDNSNRNPIAKITSDFEATQKITYHISGIGIDQPPFGIFVVDRNTGEINITAIVDREVTPSFQITCRALNALGQDVEKPLILTVKILDINDNAPVFSQSIFQGEIEENSASNSLVMILNATDADEPNHLNSKIAFKIISQEPAGTSMFLLSRHTGEVRTLTNSLDREQVSSYRLVVSGADRDGEGLSSQCECSIKVKDVNDNFPTFRESQYLARIEENTLSSELLRIQVIDLDEEFTDNWLADFFFTSGNEGHWFEIETDPRTNEGILKVVKSLDYEQVQSMQLGIAVKNKAEFHQSVISQYQVQSTPLIVQVINVREGIAFRPSSKTFTVRKGISSRQLINYVLGTYQAIDEDTGEVASFVRYVLGRNDGGLLMIDSETAGIKFVKNIDRDVTFIVNKTITAEVLAIDGNTGKTSTGTIFVLVPDFNEKCPTIALEKEAVCSSSPSVVVRASPLERDKYAGPYEFSVEHQSLKLPVVWSISGRDATSALLTAPQPVSPGVYRISVMVTDSEGRRCEEPESLTLEVCQCDYRDICPNVYPTSIPNPIIGERSGRMGAAAIGLLFLGLLLLLLALLLLLTCDCGAGPIGGVTGGFVPVPDGSEGTIHPWGIEGAQPEDKVVLPLLGADVRDGAAVGAGAGGGVTAKEAIVKGSSSASFSKGQQEMSEAEGRWEEYRSLVSGGATQVTGTTGAMVTSDTFRTTRATGAAREVAGARAGTVAVNEEFLRSYFTEKAASYIGEDDMHTAKDCLLVYSQEDTESLRGSIGCCSFIEGELDDRFLDDLGLKFKTLAEVCLGRKIEMDAEIQQRAKPAREADGKVVSQSLYEQTRLNSENAYASGSSFQGPKPLHEADTEKVTQEIVTEKSVISSRQAQKVAAPLPDTLASGSVIVTETSYATGATGPPSTVVLGPQQSQGLIVTERVYAPASTLGNQQYASEGHVVVTERVIQPHGGTSGLLEDGPPLPDAHYVMVQERERFLTPSSSLQPPLAAPSVALGQNVTVTERVLTPASALQSSYQIPAETSVMSRKTVASAAGVPGSLPDSGLEESSHSNYTITTSSTRVSKQSTVQQSFS